MRLTKVLHRSRFVTYKMEIIFRNWKWFLPIFGITVLTHDSKKTFTTLNEHKLHIIRSVYENKFRNLCWQHRVHVMYLSSVVLLTWLSHHCYTVYCLTEHNKLNGHSANNSVSSSDPHSQLHYNGIVTFWVSLFVAIKILAHSSTSPAFRVYKFM
jgi:hypothetical protein